MYQKKSRETFFIEKYLLYHTPPKRALAYKTEFTELNLLIGEGN
jgi:hypothetical protein